MDWWWLSVVVGVHRRGDIVRSTYMFNINCWGANTKLTRISVRSRRWDDVDVVAPPLCVNLASLCVR